MSAVEAAPNCSYQIRTYEQFVAYLHRNDRYLWALRNRALDMDETYTAMQYEDQILANDKMIDNPLMSYASYKLGNKGVIV